MFALVRKIVVLAAVAKVASWWKNSNQTSHRQPGTGR
jgi:hypothetical protein